MELAARNFQLHCVPHSESSYLYILIDDMKTIISECRNLGLGLAMFSNDMTETMNAIMNGIYPQHSSRGGGSATEYGLDEAFALRQTILHVFLLNLAHLEAHGHYDPAHHVWHHWIAQYRSQNGPRFQKISGVQEVERGVL